MNQEVKHKIRTIYDQFRKNALEVDDVVLDFKGSDEACLIVKRNIDQLLDYQWLRHGDYLKAKGMKSVMLLESPLYTRGRDDPIERRDHMYYPSTLSSMESESLGEWVLRKKVTVGNFGYQTLRYIDEDDTLCFSIIVSKERANTFVKQLVASINAPETGLNWLTK